MTDLTQHIRTDLVRGDRVLCNATVDPAPGGFRMVTVTGLPPYRLTRIYHLLRNDDKTAAMEGIRRFVDEMEQAEQAGGLSDVGDSALDQQPPTLPDPD